MSVSPDFVPSPTAQPPIDPTPAPPVAPQAPSPVMSENGGNATVVSPAQNLANRIDLLHANGHTNLDPIVQAHLASSSTSIKGMLDTAGVYNQALTNVGKPVDSLLASPVLAGMPNPVHLVHAALQNLHGPIPVVYSDITKIQSQMQAKGYGSDLASGGWNPQWQSEWIRYGQDQYKKPGTGNAKSLPFWTAALDSMWPSHLIPSIVNYVASIPNQVRQGLADIPAALLSPLGDKISGRVGADITNALGQAYGDKPVTGKQFSDKLAGHTWADLGNLLALVTTVGSGGSAGAGLGAVRAGVGANIAEQGVAKGLAGIVTRSLPESVVQSPKFTFVNSLYNTTGAGSSGVLKFLDNSPVLKRILPDLAAVGNFSKEGSVYYTGKQILAQRARVPLLQAGAILQNQGALAGVATFGAKTLSDRYSKDDPNGPLEPTVLKNIAGPVGVALNILGAISGSPTLGPKATQTVDSLISQAHSSMSSALGPLGIDTIIKEAMPGFTAQDLRDNMGDAWLNDFVNTKITQYAASHDATLKIRAAGLDPTTKAAKDLFQQYEHQALTDPEVMDAARSSFFAQQPEVISAFKKDFYNQLGNARLIAKRGNYSLSDADKTRWYDAQKVQEALKDPMATILSSEHRNIPYGNGLLAQVEDIKSKLLSNVWDKSVPSFAGADVQKPSTVKNAAVSFNRFLNNGGDEGEKLYHTTHSVTAFQPDSSKLVRDTPYGSGVVATPNEQFAGRTAGNTYFLRHAGEAGTKPTILDLTREGQSVISGIRKDIGDGSDVPTMGSDQIIYRRELGGLIKDGSDAVGKTSNSPEYTQLLKLLSAKVPAPGQKIVDAYRNALISGGQLSKDQIDKRVEELVVSARDSGGHAGVRVNHPKYGDQVILNPDRAQATLTKLNPEWDKHRMVASYISSLNENGRGVLGRAKKYDGGKGTMIRDDAQAVAQKAFNSLSEAGYGDAVDAARSQLQMEDRLGTDTTQVKLPTLGVSDLNTKASKIKASLLGTLAREIGLDTEQLNGMDPIELASKLWRESRGLSSEAKLPYDAPPALVAAFKQVDDLGHRVVLGTDIGHSFETPLLHPMVLEQHTAVMRKVGRSLGVDITKQSTMNVALTRRLGRERAIDEMLNAGEITRAPGDTGSRILTYVSHNSDNEPSRFVRAALSLNANTREKMAVRLLGDTTGMSKADINAAKDSMHRKVMDEFSKQYDMRDMPRQKVIDTLTKPMGEAQSILAGGVNIPRYSVADANKIYNAVLRADAKMPASSIGAAKVEDLIRATGAIATHGTASFFGKVPIAKDWNIGEGALSNAIASLPNNLVRFRDTWRFDNNPLFAYRRLAKTNVKAATMGVPAVRNPWGSLEDLGVREQAFKILERTMPDVYRAAQDLGPLDKYLMRGDVFGVFNPSHLMAWQAYHLEAQGLSDVKIAQALQKINTYGDRTPLERSINTVFYPFSFNVTLWKRIGGYMLDNTGERAILTAGLDMYKHYDPNNDLGKWLQGHAPLLQEFQKLNAFEHGTGLGQMGGINAPYFNEFMNLFVRQRTTPVNAQDTLRVMKSLVPVLSEFNSLILSPRAGISAGLGDSFRGSLIETGKTSWYATQNLAQRAQDFISGNYRKTYQTTLTDQAQLQAGMDMVSSYKTQLADAMLHKMTWPDDPNLPSIVRPANGKPVVINSQSIEDYANAIYPAYTAGAATGLALVKQAAARRYVADLRGTFRYSAYSDFQAAADKLLNELRRTKDPAAITKMVNNLRPPSVNLYEQDPQFLGFYNKFYESTFGPLEGLAR